MGAFIFYLHYTFLTSGLSSCSVLLGVVMQEYSDASSSEIGFLMMSFPFILIFMKPLFCSMADRHQNHKFALILSLLVMFAGYMPFVAMPFFPQFYLNHARLTWYLLALCCIIGNTGLGVAWSLGDTLAVNMMQRTGTPYSRMRLMGTMSWGVYGYIIGEINENPYLPKYVAGFAILLVCLIIEIVALALWNDEDFEMYDPSDAEKKRDSAGGEPARINPEIERKMIECCGSVSGTLTGTLRCHTKTAEALKSLFSSDDLSEKLGGFRSPQSTMGKSAGGKAALAIETTDQVPSGDQGESGKVPEKNLQVIILRMIFREDRRLIKYLILYTFIGFFLAPMNFLFLSLPEVCQERDCNFSRLAGSLFVTQAVIETICFLIVPWALARVSRSRALSFALSIMFLRFSYYATFFYVKDIPPYWANIGEIGQGISFAINYTILVETALMFADQSKYFITELRQMGIISEPRKGNEAEIEAEEHKIKMSLRATMQSLFSVFCDGIGTGMGNLISGSVVEHFSYFPLWSFFSICSLLVFLSQVGVEALRCRWSDNYEAKPGTKAFEILTLEREQRQIKKSNITHKMSIET